MSVTTHVSPPAPPEVRGEEFGTAHTGVEDLRATLSDHSAGAGSICCHRRPEAALGTRWATLATGSLDVPAEELWVRRGPPCDETAAWHTCSEQVAEPSVVASA